MYIASLFWHILRATSQLVPSLVTGSQFPDDPLLPIEVDEALRYMEWREGRMEIFKT